MHDLDFFFYCNPRNKKNLVLDMTRFENISGKPIFFIYALTLALAENVSHAVSCTTDNLHHSSLLLDLAFVLDAPIQLVEANDGPSL